MVANNNDILNCKRSTNVLLLAVYKIMCRLCLRKDFLCFRTVIETRVEVWENEKLQWEHEPVGRVFPRYFEFSQTFRSVYLTYGNTVKNGEFVDSPQLGNNLYP